MPALRPQGLKGVLPLHPLVSRVDGRAASERFASTFHQAGDRFDCRNRLKLASVLHKAEAAI